MLSKRYQTKQRTAVLALASTDSPFCLVVLGCAWLCLVDPSGWMETQTLRLHARPPTASVA